MLRLEWAGGSSAAARMGYRVVPRLGWARGNECCGSDKDNIYIDMQAGINFEVLRKGANSTISVVRMAFYPLDCC